MSNGRPGATIVSIDLPGGLLTAAVDRIPIMRRLKQSQHLLRADSHSCETLRHVKEILKNNKIESLFIDGDHSYDGVKQDFEMYSPLVGHRGIIGFHDIVEAPPATGGEVSRFWNEIKPRFRHRELVADRTHADYGVGLLFV